MVRKGKDGALHLRQIRHYMETGYYLPSVHINEKNGIRKSAKKFAMEDKTMYYIGKSGKEKRLVLYTNEEKNKVFHECHVMTKTGEHCGRTKTLRRLTERYYWTCMVEDIVALIVRCKACEFSKMNKSNQRFVRVTEPWEIVSVDIMGQFVSSERGHVFLAVIIDMLTKYTVAVPLRDSTTADITRALQTAVYQQGPPRKFVSDQHHEFIKELNIALELDSGLVGNVMSVNKSQMNRPDEAAIKTSLLHHCLQAGPLWDNGLHKKVYELNTTYTTGSGQTPFYLMFHRQPRPMDVIFNLQTGSSNKPNFVVRDIERYMEERKRIATDILSQAVSGQCRQDSVSVVAGETGVVSGEDMVVSEQCDVDGVSARDILEAVTSVGQASVQVLADMEVEGDVGGSVHVVANMGGVTGVDQDHAHYTPLLHHSQVVDEGGGSVYEMGDGEGQVVVVANGLPGLEDSGGGGGGREGMVVVQPGGGGEGPGGGAGGGEGIIMLAESHQVIMEAVEGHQFTYVPHT